jgi:hypothetical protein
MLFGHLDVEQFVPVVVPNLGVVVGMVVWVVVCHQQQPS